MKTVQSSELNWRLNCNGKPLGEHVVSTQSNKLFDGILSVKQRFCHFVLFCVCRPWFHSNDHRGDGWNGGNGVPVGATVHWGGFRLCSMFIGRWCTTVDRRGTLLSIRSVNVLCRDIFFSKPSPILTRKSRKTNKQIAEYWWDMSVVAIAREHSTIYLECGFPDRQDNPLIDLSARSSPRFSLPHDWSLFGYEMASAARFLLFLIEEKYGQTHLSPICWHWSIWQYS